MKIESGTRKLSQPFLGILTPIFLRMAASVNLGGQDNQEKPPHANVLKVYCPWR
jgi:hypothetical protein